MTVSARPLDGMWARAEREITFNRRAERVLTGALLVLAVATIFVQLSLIWVPMEVGIDFMPLRDAALALLHGRSVYTDPYFVYPPTAAVPMLPFAVGSQVIAFRVWVSVTIGALVATAVLLAQVRWVGHRVLVAAAGTIVLAGSAVAFNSLLLGNMSPMLVPFAVYTLLCFERGDWTRGCAVLVVSLLLKPLLAPLLLLPIVRRQWRALGLSLGPGAVVLVVACAVIPGAGELSRITRFVLGGTNLHGSNAVNNLSLQGWGEQMHHAAPALVAALIVAGVGVFGLVQWARSADGRDGNGTGATATGTAILLSVFLAGRISEVHFLLTIIATVLLAVLLRPSWRSAIAVLPGLALLVLPHDFFGGLAHSGTHLQTAYVVAQLLLLAACLRLAGARS